MFLFVFSEFELYPMLNNKSFWFRLSSKTTESTKVNTSAVLATELKAFSLLADDSAEKSVGVYLLRELAGTRRDFQNGCAQLGVAAPLKVSLIMAPLLYCYWRKKEKKMKKERINEKK